MEVKLLSVTENPIDVMYVAARTCYSAKTPIEIFTQDNTDNLEERTAKRWKLVRAVLDSGHMSIAEHVNFTFAICGVDRALTHQLVRHRLCTFSQQSQRYVEIKESLSDIVNIENKIDYNNLNTEDQQWLTNIVDKYFVDDVKQLSLNDYIECLKSYLNAIENGAKPEEARAILPNATKTNITMTINLRQLQHVCALRLCTRAQTPIRKLFEAIVKCVKDYNEEIGSLLKRQCEFTGMCPEASKCCGYKPTIQQVREFWNEHHDRKI